MKMANRKYISILVSLYLCSIFDAISADGGCDKSACKGPVKYYESLQCTPIYGTDDNCCAERYNCDHLNGRSKDKCYHKGHVYGVGEALKAEHAKPCDIGCVCREGYNGYPAEFTCAIVDCFQRPGPGCYIKKSHTECCDGPEVCPEKETGIAQCEVDGKTYLDGQVFTPSSDPTQYCICGPGYTGANVAPFCKPAEPHDCNVELRHGSNIYNNCTPGYYSSQNPATDCNAYSRCQNKDDRVVESKDTTELRVSDPSATCIFGQLTMKLRDELNSGTHYDSVCVKCVCEVPPLPTCQRLPDSECDVTVHAKFDDFSK